MIISLKLDVKVEAARVYFLGVRDREFVDEVFDEFHKERKMEYSNKFMFHGYPVFVVWKMVDG